MWTEIGEKVANKEKDSGLGGTAETSRRTKASSDTIIPIQQSKQPPT